jgi:hypothetical protein
MMYILLQAKLRRVTAPRAISTMRGAVHEPEAGEIESADMFVR